jgi:hypothetical protein
MDANGREELPPITTFLNRLLALTIDLQNMLFTAFEQLLTARIEGAVASGTYDVGLETLTAESFVVTERRTIYTHPGTGAETRLLTITQRERNHPVSLDEALGASFRSVGVLLVNEQLGPSRGAGPRASVMLDDGEVERRVRLIRPMERTVPLSMMAQTHWREADRAALRCGMAGGACRGAPVHRQRDPRRGGLAAADLEAAAERINARLSAPDRCRRAHHRPQGLATWVAQRPFEAAPALTPDAAFTALMDGRPSSTSGGPPASPRPGDGRLSHRTVRLHRHMRDRLRAYGLFSEIISWKLRLFVPTDASGPAILPGCSTRYPVRRSRRRAGGGVMAGDASELARRLSREAEAVCRHYLSTAAARALLAGRRRRYNTPGRSCSCGCGDPSGKGAAGKWTDAATGEHGDLLDIIRESLRPRRFRDVAEEARRFLSCLARAEPITPEARSSGRAGRIAGSRSSALRDVASRLRAHFDNRTLRVAALRLCIKPGQLRFHPRCYYRPG